MDVLTNQIKQLANQEGDIKALIKVGTINSYRADTYRATVTLQPEGILTGWIPIATWGEVKPLKVDTQCVVVFFNGDLNNGVVVGNIFSTANPPPQDDAVTQPGSFLFKTENGAIFKVTNSGQIEIIAPNGQAIKVSSDTNVFVGDTAQELKRLVKESLKELYNEHTHPSDGAPPDAQYHITDDDLTTVLKGN